MGGPGFTCEADDDHLVLVEFATEDAVLDTWERAGHVPAKGTLVYVGEFHIGYRVVDHHWFGPKKVTVIVRDTGE